MHYTPGWSNSSFQDLVMDFQHLFHTNHEFENRTFVWVRFFLFDEFNFVWLLNVIELNPWIEFDWVRLKFSVIGFDLLCRENVATIFFQSTNSQPNRNWQKNVSIYNSDNQFLVLIKRHLFTCFPDSDRIRLAWILFNFLCHFWPFLATLFISVEFSTKKVRTGLFLIGPNWSDWYSSFVKLYTQTDIAWFHTLED